MPLDLAKVSRIGLAVWGAGACIGIWRVLFDKHLSGYVVAVLMFAVIFLPLLIAAVSSTARGRANE
ncbi:hypothetical protein AB4Y45_33165 [Paraburkholderia sp. EG287A]|uniref:hypothetical protein n=1 Tax=Paraburkholderia sp. EG287A TaxID=3237012 RepID=UPI0034D32F6B